MPEVARLYRREAVADEDLQPGQYLQYRKKDHLGDQIWASVCCPTCKQLACITRESHSVNAQGAVYPAIRCPFECGFEEWITLDDWKPEPVGSA